MTCGRKGCWKKGDGEGPGREGCRCEREGLLVENILARRSNVVAADRLKRSLSLR